MLLILYKTLELIDGERHLRLVPYRWAEWVKWNWLLPHMKF